MGNGKPIQFRLPHEVEEELRKMVALRVHPTINKAAIVSISAGLALSGWVPEEVIEQIREAATAVEKFRLLKQYLESHEIRTIEVIVRKS